MTELTGLEKLFATAVTLAIAEIVKVGPKGYIHGWIFVGPKGPEGIGHTFQHPKHGPGEVIRQGNNHVEVQHAHGVEHYAATFAKQKPKVMETGSHQGKTTLANVKVKKIKGTNDHEVVNKDNGAVVGQLQEYTRAEPSITGETGWGWTHEASGDANPSMHATKVAAAKALIAHNNEYADAHPVGGTDLPENELSDWEKELLGTGPTPIEGAGFTHHPGSVGDVTEVHSDGAYVGAASVDLDGTYNAFDANGFVVSNHASKTEALAAVEQHHVKTTTAGVEKKPVQAHGKVVGHIAEVMPGKWNTYDKNGDLTATHFDSAGDAVGHVLQHTSDEDLTPGFREPEPSAPGPLLASNAKVVGDHVVVGSTIVGRLEKLPGPSTHDSTASYHGYDVDGTFMGTGSKDQLIDALVAKHNEKFSSTSASKPSLTTSNVKIVGHGVYLNGVMATDDSKIGAIKPSSADGALEAFDANGTSLGDFGGTKTALQAVLDAHNGAGPTSPTGKGHFKILTDPGKSGDGYAAPGLWGKYGAAGVMIRAKDGEGKERFLLVQRGPAVSSNQGKWQLPGGALDEKETPAQGAAREIAEELGATQEYLDKLDLIGTNEFNHPSGWTYSSLAADAPDMFMPKVDGTETGDAKWVTPAELADMYKAGELQPAFEDSLGDVVHLFGTPVDVPSPTSGEVGGHSVGTLAGYTKTTGALGSNPGGSFTAPNGTKYYVKAPKTDDHARNEVLANDLYRVAGVSVPDVDLVHLNGEISGKTGLGVRSKIVGGTSLSSNTVIPDNMSAARKDLAVHAWLGNWDVVGADNTNLRFDNGGKPIVIDSGGSLLYRAQGKEKHNFGPTVDELDTLRDPSKNPNAAAVFQYTTGKELRDGAERVKAITPEQIDQMVADAGFSGDKAAKLSSTLKARRQDVIKRVLGEDSAKPSHELALGDQVETPSGTGEIAHLGHGNAVVALHDGGNWSGPVEGNVTKPTEEPVSASLASIAPDVTAEPTTHSGKFEFEQKVTVDHPSYGTFDGVIDDEEEKIIGGKPHVVVLADDGDVLVVPTENVIPKTPDTAASPPVPMAGVFNVGDKVAADDPVLGAFNGEVVGPPKKMGLGHTVEVKDDFTGESAHVLTDYLSHQTPDAPAELKPKPKPSKPYTPVDSSAFSTKKDTGNVVHKKTGEKIGSVQHMSYGWNAHDPNDNKVGYSYQTKKDAVKALVERHNKAKTPAGAPIKPASTVTSADLGTKYVGTDGTTAVTLHGSPVGSIKHSPGSNDSTIYDQNGDKIADVTGYGAALEGLATHLNGGTVDSVTTGSGGPAVLEKPTASASTPAVTPKKPTSAVHLKPHPTKSEKENVLLKTNDEKIGSVSTKPDGTFIAHDTKNTTISTHSTKDAAIDAVVVHHKSAAEHTYTSAPPPASTATTSAPSKIPAHALATGEAYGHPTKIPTAQLSPESLDAIKKYTASGYRNINSYLRTNKNTSGHLFTEGEEKIMHDRIVALSKVFDVIPPTTKSIVVKRGVTDSDKFFGPPGTGAGHVFKDNGFVSTSTSQGFGGDTRIKIHLPPGSRVLKVGDYKGSQGHDETEFLLRTGSRFRILSDVKKGHERELELELIL